MVQLLIYFDQANIAYREYDELLKRVPIEQLYYLFLTTEKKWWPYLSMDLRDYRADVYNDRPFQWLKTEIEKADCNQLFYEYINEFQPWPFCLQNNQYFAIQGDGTFYLKGNEKSFDELSLGEKVLFNIYARICKVDYLRKKMSVQNRDIPILLAHRHFYYRKPKGNIIFSEPDTFLSLVKKLKINFTFVGYIEDVSTLSDILKYDDSSYVPWIKTAIEYKLRLFLKSEIDKLFAKVSFSDYAIVDVLQNNNQEIIKIQAVKEEQGEIKIFEKYYGAEYPLSKEDERLFYISNVQLNNCLKFEESDAGYYEFINGKKILVYDLFGGNVIPSRSTLKKLFGDHEWKTFLSFLKENAIPVIPYIESGMQFMTQALNLMKENALNACLLYQFIKNDACAILEENNRKRSSLFGRGCNSYKKTCNGGSCFLKRRAGAESKLICRLCRYQTAKDLKNIPETVKEGVPKIKKKDREFIKTWRIEEKEKELRIKLIRHISILGYTYHDMLLKHFGICSAKEQLLYCWLEEQGDKKINMYGNKCLITESDIEEIKRGLD